ncbi:hypothetical protein DM2_1907 [Halorubrum sp. DM2]|nr:hypothetical protein DM2_1907 [Halorubrum sp. DM2]
MCNPHYFGQVIEYKANTNCFSQAVFRGDDRLTPAMSDTPTEEESDLIETRTRVPSEDDERDRIVTQTRAP